MIRGLFPRLFGQFREGGILVGQFTLSGGGATLTPTSLSHVLVTATNTGTGLYTVTLAGGARKLIVLGQPHNSAVTVANQRLVTPGVVTIGATNATVTLAASSQNGAEALANMADASLFTIVLYADK